MSSPLIGGSALPSTLAGTGYYGAGHYTFERQPMRSSASGQPYAAGRQQATWTWAGMGTAEYDWWWTQYSRGSAMAFDLWTDDTRRTEVSFTSGWLQRPEHKFVEVGLYREVTITIANLLPLRTGQ